MMFYYIKQRTKFRFYSLIKHFYNLMWLQM